jgi:hypothetical protein
MCILLPLYMLLFIGIQILKITGYRTVTPKFFFDLHYPIGRDNDAQMWFGKMYATNIGVTSHYCLQ